MHLAVLSQWLAQLERARFAVHDDRDGEPQLVFFHQPLFDAGEARLQVFDQFAHGLPRRLDGLLSVSQIAQQARHPHDGHSLPLLRLDRLDDPGWRHRKHL
jgi:hypothetical protein